MEMNILAYRCKKCQHLQYPYRTLCRKCGHNEFTAEPLPKTGTLLTFTHLHTLPSDFQVAHISLGIVELENGTRITGQLQIKNPKIGMKVKGSVGVVRQDEFHKNYGMIFTEY